jgi:hypothetical protein
MRLAKQTILMMAEEAARHPEDEERRKRVHYFLTCESTAKLRAMVENARSEQDIAIKPQAFNAIRSCCALTMARSISTGVLQRHNADDLITLMAPVAYDPDAMHADWEEVLDRFVRADQEGRVCGGRRSPVLGDTSDKAFMNPYDENVGNTGKTMHRVTAGYLGSVRCHGERWGLLAGVAVAVCRPSYLRQSAGRSSS